MAVPKLFRWLAFISLFLSVWLSYIIGLLPIQVPRKCHDVIVVLPIYLLMSFACFSLALIGYRVATFNDCVEASKELKKQMEEAKADLRKRGFKYASDWR